LAGEITMVEDLDYYAILFLWYFARVFVYILMPVFTFIFIYKFVTAEPKKNNVE